MSPIRNIDPIFDLVAEPVSPAPYSAALSHSSAAAMATAKTEPIVVDRNTYIDCCVKWVYSVVGYLFAHKIGVSTLVFIGTLVTISESSHSVVAPPIGSHRRL